MTQGCRQAHLAASEHIKQRLFGLQSGSGSCHAADMASDAKSKKNPAAAGWTAGRPGTGKDADASGVESAKAMAGLRRGTLVKTVAAKLIHFAGTS
jgi:hypothetical protein